MQYIFAYSNIKQFCMKNNSINGSPELRARLPHGGVKMIARKHGISWTWANQVISGRVAGDPQIVEDARSMAESFDKIKESIRYAPPSDAE